VGNRHFMALFGVGAYGGNLLLGERADRFSGDTGEQDTLGNCSAFWNQGLAEAWVSVPTFAPFITMAPIPIITSSSINAPWIMAPCPR
jgi:hypothetical protein